MATGLSKLLIAAPALAVFSMVGSILIPAQVTLDGTANPNFTGPAPFDAGTYDLGAELGRRAGPNLFHSFGSLVPDRRAGDLLWAGRDRAHLTRVTGGARSDIDGTLPRPSRAPTSSSSTRRAWSSARTAASTFRARSTSRLRTSSASPTAPMFSADQPPGQQLHCRPPEVFGFLGAEPAALEVRGSTLAVLPTKTLSLVGGPLEVRGGLPTSFVAAPAGTINLVAAAQPGEVTVGDGRLRTPPTAQLGPILITDEALVFAGLLFEGPDGFARLRLRGDTIVIDGAQLSLDNLTAQDLPGVIDIRGRQLLVRNSDLTADSLDAGAAGRIRIEAGSILIIDQASSVRSDALADGAAGRIRIEAGDDLIIAQASSVRSTALADSTAGGVTLLSRDGVIVIRENSFVSSASVGGGAGGRIRVVAGELVAQGDGVDNQTGITTLSFPKGGNAGRLTVDAGRILLRDGGVLSGTASLAPAAAARSMSRRTR